MNFKHTGFLLLFLCFAFLGISQSKKVLVFSKTKGYRHTSIETGIKAIRKLGEVNGFEVSATEDAAIFTSDSLKRYQAVLFLSTTGNIFNKAQERAFKSFIINGGGFVGVHAAADTEYDWPWYGQLVGAYFESHPEQQSAVLSLQDADHVSTKGLPSKWQHFDEWYNFKDIQEGIRVVLTVDELSYTGGKNGSFHPISWYREFDGGKMFYTALGHTEAAYSGEFFLKHLLGGIQYVLN